MEDFDLPDLETWLDSFQNFERRSDLALLRLEHMRTMAEYFSHPELAYSTIHVAGSKGKGTISTATATILSAAGKSVGVYLSPHVSHFTERVHSASGPFPKKLYEETFVELKTGVENLLENDSFNGTRPTWYELVTMFAMLVFRRAKVDWAVFEVGMGGRLDATNIISPKAIGMGLIELEHTEYLGGTIAKIATEKAGVFKEGVPVFSVPQVSDAKTVFSEKAQEKNTTVTYVGNRNLDYLATDKLVAAAIAKAVLPSLSEKAIDSALKTVKLPGRFEKLTVPRYKNIPFVLLDGAHTEASISAVLARVDKEKISGVLLFACAKDKRMETMAEKIIKSNLFSKIFLTRPGEFKTADLPRLKEAFADSSAKLDADFVRAIKTALTAANDAHEPLVVLGSFYLIGEVKKLL